MPDAGIALDMVTHDPAHLPGFFWLAVVVLAGLCLGSFATALAYRLPRGISMVSKQRSACPSCDHDLGMADLVPFFSWAFLRGRCRYCRTTIGYTYPLIELGTLALCLAFFAVYGASPVLVAFCVLAPVLTAIIAIDLRYKIIPDVLNLTIFLTGVLALVLAALDSFNPPSHLLGIAGAAAGGVLAYGLGSLALRQVFLLVMKKDALGLGDVKFFAAVGIWLGLDPDAMAWFLMLSGLFGVVLALVWRKITREVEFPFGPALICAFLTVLFALTPYFIVI